MTDVTADDADKKLWKNDRCLVCQTLLITLEAWNAHKELSSHIQKAKVHSFIYSSSAFELIELKPELDELLQTATVPLLGKECIYEFHHEVVGFSFWLCSLCYFSCEKINLLSQHLTSNSHRMAYVFRFHPNKKPKARASTKQLTISLNNVAYEVSERNDSIPEVYLLHIEPEKAKELMGIAPICAKSIKEEIVSEKVIKKEIESCEDFKSAVNDRKPTFPEKPIKTEIQPIGTSRSTRRRQKKTVENSTIQPLIDDIKKIEEARMLKFVGNQWNVWCEACWRMVICYVGGETFENFWTDHSNTAFHQEDSSFSWIDFVSRVNSNCLKNLGNFVNRVLTFAANFFDGEIPEMTLTDEDLTFLAEIRKRLIDYIESLERVKLSDGIRFILNMSKLGNQYMQINEPWVGVKGSAEEKARAGTVIGVAANMCCLLSILLRPYMPEVSKRMQQQLNAPESVYSITEEFNCFLKFGHKIGTPKPLFQRIEPEKAEEFRKTFYNNAGRRSYEDRMVETDVFNDDLEQKLFDMIAFDPKLLNLVNQQMPDCMEKILILTLSPEAIEHYQIYNINTAFAIREDSKNIGTQTANRPQLELKNELFANELIHDALLAENEGLVLELSTVPVMKD